MGEEKSCPVTSSIERYDPCVKERCAWWDVTEKMCVIKSALLALRRASEIQIRGEGVE